MTKVWISEFRTEEDPGAQYPQVAVIITLLTQAFPNHGGPHIRMIEGEGPDGDVGGLLLALTDPPYWRLYLVNELTSESPWYEQANKIMREQKKNWRFRLPDTTGEHPYEVALRLYHFSSPELNNDSLLEEEQKPHASSLGEPGRPTPDALRAHVGDPVPAGSLSASVPQVPRSPVPTIGVPALGADRGDWHGDAFQGSRAPDLLDFIYKDFLTLCSPAFAIQLEEYRVGVDDFGDPNYVRLAAIGRILGWISESATIQDAEAIATRLGLMEPQR